MIGSGPVKRSGPVNGSGPVKRVRDGLLMAAGGAVTALLWGGLRRSRSHPAAARWERTNHAGDPVTLLEGVALVGGTTRNDSIPYAVASVGAGALGGLDDLRQDTDRKGLAGHLRALAHGQVTTGAIKIIGLAATGLVAVTVQDLSQRPTGTRPDGRSAASAVWSALVGGAVVAGAANLANLFDLRPGRALKVGLLTALPLVLTGPGSPGAAVTLGSSLALLRDDLAGRSMLGDTGANPLGAVLGLALVQRQGPGARTATLMVLTALTLASERVSFTRVIEATPVLRLIDEAGRPRPQADPGSPGR